MRRKASESISAGSEEWQLMRLDKACVCACRTLSGIAFFVSFVVTGIAVKHVRYPIPYLQLEDRVTI